MGRHIYAGHRGTASHPGDAGRTAAAAAAAAAAAVAAAASPNCRN